VVEPSQAIKALEVSSSKAFPETENPQTPKLIVQLVLLPESLELLAVIVLPVALLSLTST